MLYNGGVKPTRTELKAQAIALMVLGYSCRDVEHELRQQFPLLRIPHYTTIARWLRHMPWSLARGGAAQARWAEIANRAGGIAIERLHEMDRLSPLHAMKGYSMAMDIYLALERSGR